MHGIFSRFTIFLICLALCSMPVNAQKRKKNKGNRMGRDRAASECIDKTDPTLTFILDGEEIWVHTPEEVMALPVRQEIDKGKKETIIIVKMIDLLPEGWSGGRVSFISCKGQRINVPAPHLKKRGGRYIITKNRKGFLKLSLNNEKAGKVLMRDLRKIDVR